MSFDWVTGENGFVWCNSFLGTQEVTDDQRRSSVLPESMVAWRAGRLGRIGRNGAESRGDRDSEIGKWVSASSTAGLSAGWQDKACPTLSCRTAEWRRNGVLDTASVPTGSPQRCYGRGCT